MLEVGQDGKQRVTSRPLRTRPHERAEHTLRGVGWVEPRRERCGGVCYRYRATWPRGDRDNASPPLLSARRFACFGYPYLRTYLPTYVRIRRHRRRHFAQPTHIFAPLGDTALWKAAWKKKRNIAII